MLLNTFLKSFSDKKSKKCDNTFLMSPSLSSLYKKYKKKKQKKKNKNQLPFPACLVYTGKESACNAGDRGLISGLGRSPGEWNGNPLQYSYLENPMDRGAWQATVHGVANSRTWLSEFTSLHIWLPHTLLRQILSLFSRWGKEFQKD